MRTSVLCAGILYLCTLRAVAASPTVMLPPAPGPQFTPAPVAIAVPAPEPVFASPLPSSKPFPISFHISMSPAEGALIGAQAIDAFETGRCMHTGMCYETNRTVRPFSHGGAVEIFGAFLAADVLRDYVLRHAGSRAQTAALLLQGAMNVLGIIQTHNAIRTIDEYRTNACSSLAAGRPRC